MTIAGASPGDRVLVTGAGGFLGGHIVKRLAAQGIDAIAGLHRPVAGLPRAVQLDVTDAAAIAAVLTAERPTHVVNCAANGVDQSQQNYADAFAVNIQACVNLIKAAAGAGVARFIQVGTCSEYASSPQPMREDAPPQPHNLYALSKAAGSLVALELGQHLDLDVVVTRPFGLWGPGEPHFRIVPQIIDACRKQQPLALTDCDLMRDYSFVADAADWIARLAFNDEIKSGEVINIGSGRPVLLHDFALAFADRLNGSHLMEFGKRPQRPNEPESVVADVSRLIGLIGPLTHTDLDEGLRQMLAAEPV